MKFVVECTQLTDDAGKMVSLDDASRVRYVSVAAENAAAAIGEVIRGDGSGLVDRIHHVDDRQALATARRGKRALMLHAYPEEEAKWRQLASK